MRNPEQIPVVTFRLCLIGFIMISLCGCADNGQAVPRLEQQQAQKPPANQTDPLSGHHLQLPSVHPSVGDRHATRTENTLTGEKSSGIQPHSLTGQNQTATDPATPIRTNKKIKGIYVSGWTAASSAKMDRLIRLIDETELNAVVVDVKNDSGRLLYDSAVALANETGADDKPMVRDPAELIAKLKEHDIYIIGRIVAFKDPHLAGARKDLAIQRRDGKGIWRDKKGVAWVDPYAEAVRQYNLELAKEAAALGIDEIQFDYVRFPENSRVTDAQVRYQNPANISKSKLIGDFLAEARKHLHPYEVPVSADVFGLTTTATDDMGIGQQWEFIANNADIISPMIYPSHYAKGSYGIRHPDLDPFTIVQKAVKDALDRNKALDHPAAVRPWLQCFTAKWVKPHLKYGKKEIEAQIKAARSQGVEEYLLWDPTCRYKPLFAMN